MAIAKAHQNVVIVSVVDASWCKIYPGAGSIAIQNSAHSTSFSPARELHIGNGDIRAAEIFSE